MTDTAGAAVLIPHLDVLIDNAGLCLPDQLEDRTSVDDHGVYAGPIDTEMIRALDIPKTSAEDVGMSRAIFGAYEAGAEDIFPDPLSAGAAAGWDDGPVKNLERANLAMFAEASATA